MHLQRPDRLLPRRLRMMFGRWLDLMTTTQLERAVQGLAESVASSAVPPAGASTALVSLLILSAIIVAIAQQTLP